MIFCQSDTTQSFSLIFNHSELISVPVLRSVVSMANIKVSTSLTSCKDLLCLNIQLLVRKSRSWTLCMNTFVSYMNTFVCCMNTLYEHFCLLYIYFRNKSCPRWMTRKCGAELFHMFCLIFTFKFDYYYVACSHRKTSISRVYTCQLSFIL